VLVVAEQCLHQVKDFLAFYSSPPARRLEVHKKLGGDTDRTADPNWPNEYSIPR